MKLPHQTIRRRFFASNEPPYRCFVCGEEIGKLTGRSADSLNVHHADGDNTNNEPSNWQPAHLRCHEQHHHGNGRSWKIGKANSLETRKRISEGLERVGRGRGTELPDATRHKLSAALKGRPKSPETRAKMAAAARRRWAEHGAAGFGLIKRT